MKKYTPAPRYTALISGTLKNGTPYVRSQSVKARSIDTAIYQLKKSKDWIPGEMIIKLEEDHKADFTN